ERFNVCLAGDGAEIVCAVWRSAEEETILDALHPFMRAQDYLGTFVQFPINHANSPKKQPIHPKENHSMHETAGLAVEKLGIGTDKSRSPQVVGEVVGDLIPYDLTNHL